MNVESAEFVANNLRGIGLKLLNKKAFVTGAAQGIGRGIALELARAGADVAINDLRPSPQADETLAEIRRLGRQAHFIAGDVFQRASCEQVVPAAVAALGRIDVFVSNPAWARRAAFLDCDPELFERTIACTLTAGFHMSQLVARHMVARGGGGKIVFISSVQARIPFAGSVAYGAAKAGLVHMTNTIANELLPHRINVNCVEPGWIETPGEHAHWGADRIRDEGAKLPWGRIGQPEDIGRAVAFLASDEADYVTATSLLVDGGFWLRSASPQ